MDEDTESTHWVLVNKDDCVEEPATSEDATGSVIDSDQESDGSISILSDHPTDSYSEEETETLESISMIPKITPIIKINSEPDVYEEEKEFYEEVFNNATEESSSPEVKNSIEDVTVEEETSISNLTKYDDAEVQSEENNSELEWIDEDTDYEGCSHDKITEFSSNDDGVKNSSAECPCQSLAKQDVSEEAAYYDTPFGRFSSFIDVLGYSGFVSFWMTCVSLVVLLMALAIASEYEKSFDGYSDADLKSTFLKDMAEYEQAKPIITLCTNKLKSKNMFSLNTLEKCVNKKLKKKNYEEIYRKLELQLLAKDGLLQEKEHKLSEQEKELTNTRFNNKRRNHINGNKKHYKDKEKNVKKSFEIRHKQNRKREISDENKNPRQFWIQKDIDALKNKNVRDSENQKYKKHNKKDEKLKLIHHKFKSEFQKFISKQKLRRASKNDKQDPNEEWYIKYNPIKNKIEIVNITTLPHEDSQLIKNGNKSINGKWYFSLYGSSRSDIRNREKVAEWYFARSNFRESRRNKAKWYFDYMNARDNNRYY